MTENKRFILKENGVIDDTQLNILLDGGEDKEDMVDLLNELNDENKNNKKLIKRAYDDNNRLRNKNERLHKDWDKLYELCREHLTDEEIIKELDR